MSPSGCLNPLGTTACCRLARNASSASGTWASTALTSPLPPDTKEEMAALLRFVAGNDRQQACRLCQHRLPRHDAGQQWLGGGHIAQAHEAVRPQVSEQVGAADVERGRPDRDRRRRATAGTSRWVLPGGTRSRFTEGHSMSCTCSVRVARRVGAPRVRGRGARAAREGRLWRMPRRMGILVGPPLPPLRC